MAISLRILRYFVAAAEDGSTTAAARRLNVSQPSISVAIRELESQFEDALFSRGSGTKMTLTRFGERKLAEARQLLAASDAFASDEAGGSGQGVVYLGIFSTIAPVYLPIVLRLARERYPNLTVRYIEGDLAELEDWLLKGTIDLALAYDVALPADIERERLAELLPYALVRADSALAKRRRGVSLHDLAKEPLILIDLPHSRDFLMTPFWQCGLSPEIRYRAASLELVRGMVANGLGVSLLITQSPAGTRSADLVERPILEKTIVQPLVVARPAKPVRTRSAQWLSECIRDAVTEVTKGITRRRTNRTH